MTISLNNALFVLTLETKNVLKDMNKLGITIAIQKTNLNRSAQVRIMMPIKLILLTKKNGIRGF